MCEFGSEPVCAVSTAAKADAPKTTTVKINKARAFIHASTQPVTDPGRATKEIGEYRPG
jgi:hypothetical protein